jgi:phage FluMu protein Com
VAVSAYEEKFQVSDVEKKCPKCQGAMEEGFIRDVTHGATLPSEWYEGTPEKSFWTGLKTSGRAHYEIRSFRCTRCGYLESYAG